MTYNGVFLVRFDSKYDHSCIPIGIRSSSHFDFLIRRSIPFCVGRIWYHEDEIRLCEGDHSLVIYSMENGGWVRTASYRQRALSTASIIALLHNYCETVTSRRGIYLVVFRRVGSHVMLLMKRHVKYWSDAIQIGFAVCVKIDVNLVDTWDMLRGLESTVTSQEFLIGGDRGVLSLGQVSS